jgi:outer membrane protein assembly factor BamB
MATATVAVLAALLAGGPVASAAAAPNPGTGSDNQYLYDAGHSGFDRNEHTLGVANVASLVPEWTVQIPDSDGSTGSAPAVTSSGVYDVTNNVLERRSLSTGQVLWSVSPEAAAIWTPAIADGEALTGGVQAVSTATGAKVWRDYFGNPPDGPDTVDGTTAIVSTANNDLAAVDVSTGQTLWSTKAYDLRSGTGVGDGLIFLNTSGGLTAFNEQTGALVWKTNHVSAGTSATYANGMVYGYDYDYDGTRSATVLAAVDPATGAIRWTSSLGTPESISQPTVANGIVYIGADDVLYALDAATGQRLWSFTTRGDVHSPVIANGVVYFGADGSTLYALNAHGGALLWKTPTRAPYAGDVVVAAGHLYTYSGQYTSSGQNIDLSAWQLPS